MINNTHLKVLLRKDFITLWRSKVFCLMFLLVPIILMLVITALRNLLVNGSISGSMIYDNFKYTSTKPWLPPTPIPYAPFAPQDFFEIKAMDIKPGQMPKA